MSVARVTVRASFPPEPLLAHLADLTSREAGNLLGVEHSTVAAWRQGRRRLSLRRADLAAVDLGYHPSSIWPEWFAE